MVVDDRFDPNTSAAVRAVGGPTRPLPGVAVPLIRDDVVVGALTLLRLDLDRAFAPYDERLAELTGLDLSSWG